MFLIPIPAFAGSYPGLLHNAKQSLVIEPGDAKPAFRFFEQRGLQPASILVKRPPARHANGDAALQKASGARVCGPAVMRIAAPVEPLPGSRAAGAPGWQGCEPPTLPYCDGQESLINPFLPMRQAPVVAAVCRFDTPGLDNDTPVFAALRQ